MVAGTYYMDVIPGILRSGALTSSDRFLHACVRLIGGALRTVLGSSAQSAE